MQREFSLSNTKHATALSAAQNTEICETFSSPTGADHGDEETAEAEESKSVLAFTAVVAVVILLSILLLAALGYLLKLKWQKRKQ